MSVSVVFSGGIYRARTRGSNIVAFGETATQAKQRLKHFVGMRSSTFKECDLTADRLERAAEREGAKAYRRAMKFAPKGNR
jgi:hypothetical protein